MACPFRSYRESADGRSFDEARAYCEVAERFVQPMRADVCSDRFDLDHAADCEIYRDRADAGGGESGTGERGPDASAGEGDGS